MYPETVMYQNFSRLPLRQRTPQAHLRLEALDEDDRRDIVGAAALFGHPWLGYAPSPITAQFHQAQERNRYIIAASQVGKTLACARETWMYAGDCHPWREVPRKARFGLIAVGSLEGTAYDGVNRALYNTRPDHLIDWDRTTWNGKNFVGNYIVMRNGTIIRLVSSRGGSTGAASVTADFVWIDEPPKRDKFSELLARVTQTGGHVWLSFTPYDSEQADLDWLRNYLEGDPEKGTPPESPGWGRFNLELSVANCPWMVEDDVAAIYAQTPLWVADQRLKGAWETPPVDGYFVLNQDEHDGYRNPYDFDAATCGAWHWRASVDHGELAAHQAAIFFGVRKVRRPRPTPGGLPALPPLPGMLHPVSVEVLIVGEYVSTQRTTFEQDATGIRAVLDRVARGTAVPQLAEPAAWSWVGDINSAGKGMAGVSANEALALALGIRRDAFETPDKSPGSVADGLLRVKTAVDTRPCPLRIAHGGDERLSCPLLWRAMRAHNGKADATKHLVDTLRYGVVPFLAMEPTFLRRLAEPTGALPFAPPRRR